MRSPRTLCSFWRRHAAALLTITLAIGGAAGCVQGGGPTPTAQDPSAARERLDELIVAPAGSMRGYRRERFPHWTGTGPNCDVRDEVLRRDGEEVRLRGCDVIGGKWRSRYDGRTVTEPSLVDIDHTVPLADAWRSGASSWSGTQRERFANDVTRPQLIAVSRTSNRAKGDQDPARWKPPDRTYWCQYAQDWIFVKHHWKLTVTTSERTDLTKMLDTCR